jgi:hypothetical protein
MLAMKTNVNVFRSLVLGGVLAGTFATAHAVIPEDIRFTILPNKKVLLESNLPQGKTASIEITDQASQDKVYEAAIKSKKSNKTVYDLSSLPEGEYTIKVDLEDKVMEKGFRLDESTSSMTSESAYSVPVFVNDNGVLHVMYDNNADEKVEVSFSKYAETFFTDVIDTKNLFTRPYNLKNLDRGTYNVVVKSGDKEFGYTFSKM